MLSKEYASAVIDSLIAKEIVVTEEEKRDDHPQNKETFYTVTRKGRAIQEEACLELTGTISKKRDLITIYTSQSFTQGLGGVIAV